MQKIKILFTLIFLMIPSFVVGAEEVEIGQVVVTASRTEEAISSIPANVTVITQEDIKKSPATTVPDLLANEEGLIVRDFYGNGSKSTIDMRGFAKGINTLVMIDGRRVNEIDLSGVDWNLIPLENIERIEIVRGTGSVLYGDNATSGVINIITKRGGEKLSQMEVEARMGSYGENMQYMGVKGVTDKVDYFIFAKHRETEGYRDNSEFNAKDVGGKFSADLVSRLALDLSLGYHLDRQGYPGGLTKAQVDANRKQTTNPNDGTKYDQYFYDTKVIFDINDTKYIEAGYSFNSRSFDSDLFGGKIIRDTDVEGYKLKFVTEDNIFSLRNELVTGVDVNISDVDNISNFGLPTFSDIEKKERGYYLNNVLHLRDNLSLSAGYRYSSIKFENTVSGGATGSGGETLRQNASKVGVAYNYAAGSKAFVSLSKGFRMPSTDELFSYTGTIVDLKPERTTTTEVGVAHQISRSVETRLTLYTMEVKDELHYNAATFSNENLEESKHNGVEAGFNARVGTVATLFGNYVYSKATFEAGPNEGKILPLVPKHSANIGTHIKLGKNALSLNGNWVGSRFQDSDETNTSEKIAAHFTADVKASHTRRNMTLYLGVDNVFNKKYSDYAVYDSYYPAPERKYYGGLKTTF